MNKIRYGVIGASGIAHRRVLPAFAHCEFSELTAICSRQQEKAAQLAQEFHAPFACTSLEAMLPEVDAVYVATPVHCHLDEAKTILHAGRHLLLEKPLARTVAEAEQILAVARQSSALAMEAYMMKFHPAHHEIQSAVASGRIGRVVYARARLGCWYPDQDGAWRQDPTLGGGGALMDLGSHLIDLLTWIVGPVQSLRGLCNTQLFNYQVEDSATLVLGFQGGAHGLVEAYFSMPDQVGTGVLEIIGTQGRILAQGTIGQNGSGSVDWETFPPQADYNAAQSDVTNTRSVVNYPAFDLYAAQLDYFSRCIRQQTAPELNRFEEGLETLRWIARAYE